MEWSPMALVYAGCAAFGFLLAIVTIVLGEVFGHADFGGHDVDVGAHAPDLGGHDIDLSHPDTGGFAGSHPVEVSGGPDSDGMVGTSVLNTLTILTFIACFGLAGLFAVGVLKLDPLPSLGFALPVGALMAALEFVLYVHVFIKAQGSSEATLSETLGCPAEVITGIPAGRVGEIAYIIKGARYTAPAASADGQEIARGTSVYIVNVKANTYVVRPA